MRFRLIKREILRRRPPAALPGAEPRPALPLPENPYARYYTAPRTLEQLTEARRAAQQGQPPSPQAAADKAEPLA